ncbi:MAG: sulfatase-like hydrolase/transferase [Acidobacteriota bacterium]
MSPIRPLSRVAPLLVCFACLMVACGGQENGSPPGAATGAPSPDDGGASPAAGEGPNGDVVLITVDTLRWDAVGFAEGDSRWKSPTPRLDKLASSGRRYPRAFAHNTITLPSHANMLTGLYPYQHGVRENVGFRLGEDFPTLATLLADRGYRTGAFVSAFTLDSRYGLDRGFEVYDDQVDRNHGSQAFLVSERRGDAVSEAALAWWREQAGHPRFLWLHLFDPHAPYAPPEPWASKAPDHPYPGEVAAVDHFLSGLLDDVETAGDEPLVIFTSDHGEGLGDHGEDTHGIFAYQSTLAVPLVIWGAGIEPGVDRRLARHVDLLPTVLERLGLPKPADLPGRSLLSAAEGEESISYFEAMTGNLGRGWAPLRGVVRGDWKYIDLPIPELYDLAADPGEQRNLASEERRTLAELRALLPEESSWPPPRQALSPEEEARLRSLGYLGDTSGGKGTYGPDDDPKRLIALDSEIQRWSGLFASGRFPEAAEVARGIVSARPSMPTGHTLLSQALLESGQSAEALAVMEAAFAAGHASPLLTRQLGLTLAEAGRPAEAVAVLEPLAASGDGSALSALGLALIEVRRPEDAVDALRRALDVIPDDAETYERLSAAELHLERFADARDHAQKAVTLDPGRPHAWNNLGVALALVGEPGRALGAWERAVELDPNQFDTLFNLGIKAAELGRPDLARRALRDFVDRAPRDRYAADLPRARGLLRDLGPE